MRRTIFLTHSAAPAGAELALLRLVKHLTHSEATVVFTSHGPMVKKFEDAGLQCTVISSEKPGVKVTRSTRSLRTMLAGMQKLRLDGLEVGKFAEDSDTDVIVARSVKALFMAYFARRVSKVPVVWSVHDRVSKEYFGHLSILCIRALGRFIPSGYICNSNSTRSTIWTGPRKPIAVIPPGIELRDRTATQRVPGGEQLTSIAIVGRLAPWKGQDVFLDAFAAAFANDRSNIRAKVIGGALFGEEDFEQALKKQATTLGIAHRVDFLGHVDDVSRELESSQVLVHASVMPEPFGAVVIEGMNAGCAVIATKPGGPAEVIEDGVNGLLVDCGDTQAMADALSKLNSNSQLREQLAKAGTVRAQEFDVRVFGQRTEEWLQQFKRETKK